MTVLAWRASKRVVLPALAQLVCLRTCLEVVCLACLAEGDNHGQTTLELAWSELAGLLCQALGEGQGAHLSFHNDSKCGKLLHMYKHMVLIGMSSWGKGGRRVWCR